MAHQFTTSYLEDATSLFAYYKKLGDKAMAQLSDAQLNTTLDPEMNSIAIIVKHMAGNMRSRWTDFRNSDGEKASRNRDSEFEAPPATRQELLALWEDGWQILFTTLATLNDTDLSQTVSIRGEAHSVLQAINRQLTHYGYHCGQIVLLAKHLASSQWDTLSIPRRASQAFNQAVAAGEKSQR